MDHSDDVHASIKEMEVRQRLRKYFKVVIDIGRREGLIGKGLTLEQAREIMSRRSSDTKDGKTNVPAEVESKKVIEPVVKEIHVRLPQVEWEQIMAEAHRRHITHTALVHKWILDGLSRRT